MKYIIVDLITQEQVYTHLFDTREEAQTICTALNAEMQDSLYSEVKEVS